jgi:histidine phosphotransferase ChpT
MMPKRAVKILLNLVLFANDALVRGGTLSVGAEARSGEQEIVIRASGPKIVMDSAIREALTGQLDPAAVDSRTAAAWMAYMLAVQGGGMLQLAEPDAEHLLIGALIRV